MSELGYALLFVGRFWTGRDLLMEGADLLENAGGPGFRARALRKLSRGLSLTGRLSAARDTLKRAEQLAEQHRMFDQLK